ncbi:MAG: hypothetical protein LUD16_05525, partial [Lachnospiraceae bacterium]|nr:hypothetical protein [Lachnospiraceae bacterium]
YIDQKISDISEGECLNIYALPIGMGSVEESDDKQEAIAVLCCYVKKTSNFVGNIKNKITNLIP